MNRRRGISLLEVITAMTVGSVIVGLAVGLLYTLFNTQSMARDHLHQNTVLCRLGEQFRHDVHAATAAVKDDTTNHAAPAWRFVLAAEHAVTYRAEPGRIIRVETAGAGNPRREEFFLPPGTAASIDVDKETSPTIVTLHLTPAAGAPKMPGSRSARFDAVLAADRRFEIPHKPRSDEAPNG